MYNVGAGSGNLGAKTGFVFMGSSVLLFIMAYLWIPETQGRTTEELDSLYERRISPRKFGKVDIRQPVEKLDMKDHPSPIQGS